MNEFGEFLYALRKEKGMTQAELADALGITNKAVSKWETGEAMPETALLKPLARIFDVTVDELLDGRRSVKEEFSREEGTSEKQSNISDDDIDAFFTEKYKQHLFARGKEVRTVYDKISGSVCAAVFLFGLAAFLYIGSLTGIWHPYWVIVPACALGCGIIGIIFDVADPAKRKRKLDRGENPYVGAVCGTIMLLCIICYLLLGALASLWHPMWIIIVSGAVACGIIGSLGEVLGKKK